ncbi:MAG: hypothetical protein R3B07_19335 [Polyangiaceae bacterium]
MFSKAGQAAKPSDASLWRFDLEAHGAWLPGQGTRGAVGVGAGVGYGPFDLGIEAWAYHLTLYDSWNHERRDYDTEVLAMVLGGRFPLGNSSWIGGADLGLGLDLGGESLEIGTGNYKYYGPWVMLYRVYVAYRLGNFSLGPHVGYTYDLNKASGDGNGQPPPDPDPLRKAYPSRLPFGFQLGLTLGVTLP